mmetsp:Transcript_58774/g.120227  ORF Transcript_58774/g.120227 Transcript_58774/m.120227 type:complete len:913 (+) Transcript_58774:43-2781(+)|eukprot:CAMPEP_0181303680 /NCGR_PEP_ID=MMETSP1101-20121128/8699_1 /TAXON_ID=46948 /ORGANISM="Rhodomonas abbreviata, Strain Caron Lab Isolate" /LENGTH=912 /DNA_ID=CAMNT_0023409293 /DNA_START=73 /DNA_END=2811 /DNA_ORIENTATION=-
MLRSFRSVVRQQKRFKPLSIARPFSVEISNETLRGGILPDEADVVIIGGGSVGTSTLYHLAKMGVNAVLLEKDDLTSGTTWHSAGLLWRLRPSDIDIQLIAHTRELAQSLEAETGETTGWNQNGGLFICSSKERMHEYQRLSVIGQAFGIESHMLTPSDTKQVHPLINVDDIFGALYSEGDGTIDPSNWVTALAKGAKMNGAKIFTKTPVADINTTTVNGVKRVESVVTAKGDVIKTKKVLNCGGVWAPSVSAMVGVGTPLCAMKHAYVVTGKIPGVKGTPNVRDHDSSVYFKQQGEILQIGGYEQNPNFWDEVDPHFHFGLFELDWDAFACHIDGAINRMGAIAETEIKHTVCGPESFTPDHKALMGEVPGCRGFFLGAGFNSNGIMLAGGAGRELAHWVAEGHPTLDMFSYDVKRFHPDFYGDKEWIKETSHESYAKNYAIAFSCDEPMAGRNRRLDPFHEQMKRAKCVFQSRHHWERPGFFATKTFIKDPAVRPYDFYGNYGHEANEDYGYRDIIHGENTFEWTHSHVMVAQEVTACREYCAVFNQSYFGKFFLEGPDTQAAMDFLCANDVRKPDGTTIYTQMCNPKGGIMADLTVTKLAADRFYITAGGGTATHDFDWISKVIEEKGFDCTLRDETQDHGLLSLQGPLSHALLRELVLEKDQVALENFPFSTAQDLTIRTDSGDDHAVRVIRLTFVGELGFELHIPKESCAEVYEELFRKGKKHHLANAGYRAIDSMSIEKGYKHWHEDVRMDDTPLEAGLGWAVKLKTDVDFCGREALEAQKEHGVRKRLICLTLESHLPLHKRETIWNDGQCVGYIRRADYGHTSGKVIGYGYVSHPEGEKVTNKWLKTCNFEVHTTNREFVPAVWQPKVVFDPSNERVKGNYELPFRTSSSYQHVQVQQQAAKEG